MLIADEVMGLQLSVVVWCSTFQSLFVTLQFLQASGMQGSVWLDLCGTRHTELHMIILLCFSILLFETVTQIDDPKLLRLYFHSEKNQMVQKYLFCAKSTAL